MTTLTPYLLFDGNCRQAMEFYRSCLGGELILTVVKDTPKGGAVTDPLSQQFFGTSGALNDQFGVRWMFHTHTIPVL